MSATFNEVMTMRTEFCCSCGIPFAFTTGLYHRLKADGKSFFCPNGHSQHYTETETARLTRLLEEKQREVTAAKCDTLAEQHRREAAEADLKRHERRTKHGVCPCCRRTFVRLSNHISKVHPKYGPKQKRKLP